MRVILPVALLLLAAACAEATERAPTGGAGGDDHGGGGEDGTPACVDHSTEGGCRDESASNGCGDGELCGLPSQACGASERCCTLATDCQPRGTGRPGGAVCDEDSDCAGAVCLPVAGRGLCFRACSVSSGRGCPVGTHCAVVSLESGASVSTCLGGTREAPEPLRTICRVDRECPEGRVCRLHGYEDAAGDEQAPVGLCSVPIGGEATELGLRCDPSPDTPAVDVSLPSAFSASCPGYGACAPACAFVESDLCLCSPEQFAAGACRSMRCTRPCRGDLDCSDRYVCANPELVAPDFPDRDEAVRICALPSGPLPAVGCMDELDCCEAGVFRGHGGPCCNWSPTAAACHNFEVVEERTHCAVQLDPATPGRLLTVCRRPEALAGPGAPCAVDGDCVSGLCVAGPQGRACTSPCERLGDRCGTILPGSQCCPTSFGDGLCVEACRFDCGAEPACALN